MDSNILISQKDTNKVDLLQHGEHDTEIEQLFYKTGQLTYANNNIFRIPNNLIENYCMKAKRLDLSHNQLSNLRGLECFMRLEELVLDSNCIDDNTQFPRLNRLQTLTLNKNKINNLENLICKLKTAFPGLKYLSLLGNHACPNELTCSENDDNDYQSYRYYVLSEMEHLKFLDSSPVRPSEVKEASRIGSLMKVAKPVATQEIDSKSIESPFNPLPTTVHDENPKVKFGKSKYVYFGRHSEGNRYIKNRDL